MKKSFPKHQDLICCSYIFNSYDYFSVVEDLYAGFDNDFNLIILCEHTDYDAPDYNCAICAIVKKEEAYRLAKRLKVSLCELPMEISNSMSEWNEIACPMPRDVRDCFKEITECLLEEGCRFKIERTYGKEGYMSC